MNRAFTVWLDLSAQSQSGAVATALTTHSPLPAFPLPLARPMTKREIVTKLLQLLWAGRAHIAAALLLWKLLAKLRQLSISTHTCRSLCGPLDVRLFPQYVVSPSTGLWLHYRSWRVPPHKERGIIFIVHAYREHIGRYEPLVAALNEGGFSVYGHDHQGHGQSGGERGYVESFQHYVLDALHFVRHIQREVSESGGTVRPVFLLGHSMGATIALQMARIEQWRMEAAEEDRDHVAALLQAMQPPPSAVSLRSPPPAHAGTAVVTAIEEDGENEVEEEEEEAKEASDDNGSSFGVRSLHSSDSPLDLASSAAASSSSSRSSASSGSGAASSGWRINGLLLSAPALIPPSVSPLLQALASLLADVLPKARPAGAVLDWTRLSGLRAVGEQWRTDPLTLKSGMPARWASEMLAAMGDVRDGLAEIALPTLVLQGRRDRYVSPAGAQFAMDHLGSADKSICYYDSEHDAWLDESRAQFAADCVSWLQRHTKEPRANDEAH